MSTAAVHPGGSSRPMNPQQKKLRTVLPVVSASLAALEDEDGRVKSAALQRLYKSVDEWWSEAANAVSLIEELSEDVEFEGRELAAAVASKIFFHLEEYDESLRLALGAGAYFDISTRSEYVETLVARCVDEYVSHSSAADNADRPALDPRLEEIVERMFLRCYEDEAFEHAVGIALEAQRLDKLRDVLSRCPTTDNKGGNPRDDLCKYAAASTSAFASRDFRKRVMRLLVDVQDMSDSIFVCHALQALGDADEMANVVAQLASSEDPKNHLLAVQLAFVLVESGNQKFIADVVDRLTPGVPTTESSEASAPPEATMPDVPRVQSDSTSLPSPPPPPTDATTTFEAPTTTAATTTVGGATSDVIARTLSDPSAAQILAKVRKVLDVEGIWSELQLNFLFSTSEADVFIIKNLKEAVDGNRNSVLHNAVVIAHGFMHAGTTNTTFLSENLEWMGKASNWAKFSATASIGVVHMGHISQSIQLLQPYLPNGGAVSSPYSEGGALYALGLIHANRGGLGVAKPGGAQQLTTSTTTDDDDEAVVGSKSRAAIEYLSEALRNASNVEALQHGACLGIGLAAMGTGDERLYEELKTVLFFDSAVAGEAAAYGIGLLLAGHGCDSPFARSAVTDLLNYAHETAHEKIIRGLVLALALMVFGHEEAAEPVIEQLSRDRDAIIRYGGMYAIGLAYAGTSNNGAVKRLLHVAVSDVSDDVRRAAVTNLGFLLFRTPEKVPTLVRLLAESFNPHVRYGACLAVGIACAGSGDETALSLVQPMLSDQVDFVRQGALLATALVLMQQSEFAAPAVKGFREKLASIVKDKYPSTLTKLGAIYASGVLDAGGRNCAVQLQTNYGGFVKASACIGLTLWCQHWFWYPMHHFFSLALTPSMMVGVNSDFKLPGSFKVKCATNPLHFAYPAKLKAKKEVKKERVVTAILSTTLKQQAKDKAKQAEKDAKEASSSAMDVDASAGGGGDDAMETGLDGPKDDDTTSPVAVAPPEEDVEKVAATTPAKSYFLSNPSRVTKAQERYCTFEDQRYVPVASTLKPAGVVVLMDRQPDDGDDAMPMTAPPVNGADDEAPMPEPFEWTPP